MAYQSRISYKYAFAEKKDDDCAEISFCIGVVI